MSASDTSQLSLLGRSENRLPTSPEEAKLEFFQNRHAQRDYWIHLDCPEFSVSVPSLVSLTWLACRSVMCRTNSALKQSHLKFYLASFRNLPSFNEDIVNRVLTDLSNGCKPRRMVVRGTFGSRGGIQLTCQASIPDGADAALGLLPL